MKIRRIADVQAARVGCGPRSWLVLVCCGLLPAAAWGQDVKGTGPAPCAAQPQAAGPRTQGRSIQGRSIQGRSIQGRSIQGQEVAVSTVVQIQVKGTPVGNLQLQ